MKKKIVYSNRLLMVPSPESGREIYFSHIPKKSEWINTSHYIHDTKAGFVGKFCGANIFRPQSTHKRVFKKGSKIRNIATFRKWCMNGGPVYYNHKFMHYGFIVSMPFRAICDALSRGIIWKAVRI